MTHRIASIRVDLDIEYTAEPNETDQEAILRHFEGITDSNDGLDDFAIIQVGPAGIGILAVQDATSE